MSSIQNVSSRAGSDLVPSLFGTSGGSIESTRSGTSGSNPSQDELSSSSVWSLGQPAAGHMLFRAYAPMVMTAQDGAVQANTQMGMQIVQTILPPPLVMTELDDVVMSESGRDIPGRDDLKAERTIVLTDHPVALTPKPVVHDAKMPGAIGHPEGRQAVGRIQSVPVNRTQEALARIQSELAQKRQADEAILAAHAEAAIQAERFRAAKETEDRLKAQQFQTEADFAERLRVQRMQDESECARWVDDVQNNTNMQIAILQQQMREMEAERDREREAAKSIQKFQASQLRDLRATSSQVQHATVTPVPDAVSQIKAESGIANFQQDAKGHDAGNVAVKKEKSADKEAAAARADAILAAQLQATIQSVNAAKQRTKPATAVSTALKIEAGTKATKAPAPKPSDDARMKAKKATSKARASKKVRRGGYPSDSDPSSEDDDSDSSSDDSDTTQRYGGPQGHPGRHTMTIRPFVTASSLDDFDEKASLSERTRWWERFQTLAFQGGCSNKMKVYELRLKLSSSARNWRSQLSPHVRHD
ncbi:hypothetical protein PHMEG_00031698 [Phytophthora megakarya]|uniref:Uncharacterized protein n=1 Tax=Phytophthora megakarya TaxID=4795 RepID=A0A225UXN3_9STRA|nr:hypothetical protein PHMEG_00031698 [Phytophthora megakarya]